MRMFGASSAQDMLGHRIYDRIHPGSHPNVQARLKKSLDEGVSAPMVELQYLRLDGSIVDAEVQGIPILYDGAPAIYAVLADISARKQAEQALSYAHWQLESTIQGTHVGTWEWNVQTGETVFNEIWAQIIGYSLDELAPISIQTWELQVHPDDLILSSASLERHFAGELPYYDCELRMKHKDGHWVWVQDRGQVITRTVDGKPLLMFGTHMDISERKAAEEKILLLNRDLENLALTDSLTHLFNRRNFMLRGSEAVKRVTRTEEPLALLMLDIDWFKQVNDNYGHGVGDLALQHVAGVLQSSLREIDFLARIGGEEFAVLLPNTGQADAVDLAERVRKSIQDTPFEIAGESIIITISLGVAVFGKGILDIDDLLRDADLALYDAKHSGRNCVRVFRDNLSPPPRGRGMGSK
jgi:diguanylate cyclase (GGDEF)-like protein/PAS domain S-box-containing protein